MANTHTIESRLNRAAGQVHAVGRMIDEGRACEDVIPQFQAAKAALEGAFSLYLEESAATCAKHKDTKTLTKLIGQLTRL